eukprot:TRINITY_DN5065_c0_g1_i1.p1 TRINITY_DN5065_c0_g1~~TRINITY_DN5065_c0_g1_i1.p1  ORF type:complete len:293 (+),score=62.34 TRINITY_DN5065_c0_g1_i1:52-879(+)
MNQVKPLNEVLEKLSYDVLLILYRNEFPESKKKKENAIREELKSKIEEIGIQNLIKVLKFKDLKLAAEAIPIEFGESDNKKAKPVIVKNLNKYIKQRGINDTLEAVENDELFRTFCTAVGITFADSKEDNVKDISAAVRAYGLESLLYGLQIDLLKNIMKDLKLKTRSTNSRRKLVEAVMALRNVKKSKTKKDDISYSKTKKPIEDGITFDDIFQHYYVGEVREYCKSHGIKTAGKKTVLIKRILQYLSGDTTDIMVRKRKRESESSPKKKQKTS